MNQQEQYIKDLEERLEKQEEVFQKQIQEITGGLNLSKYQSFPIDMLCGIQGVTDSKKGIAYATRYTKENTDGKIESVMVTNQKSDFTTDEALPVEICKYNAYNLITNYCETIEFSISKLFKVSEEEFVRVMVATFLRASNEIRQSTQHLCNHIIYCSIQYKKYFDTYFNGGAFLRFNVIYDMESRSLGDIFIGCKGASQRDAGLIYCPTSEEYGVLCQVVNWENYYKVVRLV